ncbi:type 2 isopentenyl-diphosphate Delta-isomerase [Ligilactobacillus ceti]|uniref:Isopentenyl-diphosphate delta-isomerase n=1 Tax=Ligilactobacillus ceti DSM 22408 TaxID=1122146 RepID=A0A0R2KGY5_9LACO|nr:type 2 isopentenyl-diphosphate Delta-isomerase [Ligilactobacillus ceti]KRN88656.1 isopentenyl pyrophosphate isomerase [Ligilactobacillus ceti DSM 22408]
MEKSLHAQRKNEHVFIAEKQYQAKSQNGLDQIRLISQNLPELSLNEINLETKFLNTTIPVPFFINAMTGGSQHTTVINEKLALCALQNDIPMATGSLSVALKENSPVGFDTLRKVNPTGFVLGNLGAGHDLHNAIKAINLIQADALEIHLNASQELVMPEGDREFHWLANLQNIVENSPVPILVKEVGFGMTPRGLDVLKAANVKYVDLAGAGGTSFVSIENERRERKELAFLNELQLSTAESLIAAQPYQADFSLTASGGIRSALDIVKCLVLGADNVGISGLFLHTLLESDEAGLNQLIADLTMQIKQIMLLLGCKSIAELREVPYILSPELLNFQKQIQK